MLIELVALGHPSPHAAFAQGHLFQQAAVGINFVAFKGNIGNLGRFALFDGNVDRHAVAGEFGDGRRDFDRLFATAQILFFQTGDGLVQCCLVEVLGLRQTEGFKVFLDGIVLQHFRAGNIERADGRTLNYGQQDLIVHGLDAYVVKETGCVEFLMISSLRASLKLSPTLTGR